jgi:hypothetical protein
MMGQLAAMLPPEYRGVYATVTAPRDGPAQPAPVTSR